MIKILNCIGKLTRLNVPILFEKRFDVLFDNENIDEVDSSSGRGVLMPVYLQPSLQFVLSLSIDE